MLFSRQDKFDIICVLKIDAAVLDLQNVVVTDQNAAAEKYVRFGKSPEGLEFVDKDLVFAERWTHPENSALAYRHKSVKCAEILVPDKVESKYILGGYTSSEKAKSSLESYMEYLPVEVNSRLFFL